jgi:HK97 family phage prohead protease
MELQFRDAADKLVTCAFEIIEKSISVDTREADFVASTASIDSHDEIVAQNWNLEFFKKNPIALFAHKSRELPIGICTRVEMVPGPKGMQLECTIKFSTADLNPLAEQVWLNVQAKVLRAVSVGFIPQSVRWEMRDGRDVYVLDNNILYEISVTPIGANPDALAKMKSKARESAEQQQPVAVAPVQTEKSMTEEEMKAAIAAKDAELAAAKAEVEDLKTKATIVEAAPAHKAEAASDEDAVTKAAQERDAAVAKAAAAEARALDLEAKAIERDVDVLVGTKIKPAQKDAFVALAKKDRGIFDAIVEGLDELPALKSVMGADPNPVTIEPEDLSVMYERALGGASAGDVDAEQDLSDFMN